MPSPPASGQVCVRLIPKNQRLAPTHPRSVDLRESTPKKYDSGPTNTRNVRIKRALTASPPSTNCRAPRRAESLGQSCSRGELPLWGAECTFASLPLHFPAAAAHMSAHPRARRRPGFARLGYGPDRLRFGVDSVVGWRSTAARRAPSSRRERDDHRFRLDRCRSSRAARAGTQKPRARSPSSRLELAVRPVHSRDTTPAGASTNGPGSGRSAK
jgi:hypothetical protein